MRPDQQTWQFWHLVILCELFYWGLTGKQISAEFAHAGISLSPSAVLMAARRYEMVRRWECLGSAA